MFFLCSLAKDLVETINRYLYGRFVDLSNLIYFIQADADATYNTTHEIC